MRKLCIILMCIFAVIMQAQENRSGSCGADLFWSYDESSRTLEITGSGDMDTYPNGIFQGWNEFASDIAKIIIPSDLTGVGYNTFYYCKNVKELVWSARRVHETSYYSNPFIHCSESLSVIRIEGHIEYLPDYFLCCKNLDTLEISAIIDTIGNQLFTMNKALNVANIITATADWCKTEILDPSSSPMRYAQTTLFDGKQLVVLNIPDSVKRIGRSVFNNIPSLTKVTLGKGIKSIGWGAFAGCGNLMTVVMSDSVEIIDKSAFSYCLSLKNINISKNLKYIGNQAFSGCTKIQSMSIPETVNEIEASVFDGCTSLTSLHLPNSINKIPESFVYGCSELVTINVPESVTEIGANAFYQCNKLSNITLSDSIRKIGTWAFFKTKLTSINIPLNTETIEINAFYDLRLTDVYWNARRCNQPSNSLQYSEYGTRTGSYLINLHFGEDVEYIPSRLLSGNKNIHSISIPYSVRHIEPYAFSCSEINNVSWNPKVCASFNSAQEAPFYMSRDKVQYFSIGNMVDSIPNYLCYGMTSLTDIQIPDSVQCIGDFAFTQCSALYNVSIGKNIRHIGDFAFMSCVNVSEIVCRASTPPSVGDLAFEDIPTNIVIRVPCGSIDLYKEAPYWGSFTNYQTISIDELYNIDITSSNSNFGRVDYHFEDCALKIVAIPYENCSFIGWSDGNDDIERSIEVDKDIDLVAYFAGIGTANGESNATYSPQSTLRNGQILIKHDNKTYTVQGVQLQ